ncbi:MAG: pimeloyl-ACP methyl ester carboxylesterase [Candidatus Aldehydirespiratoraceae bacterium]|jgi:pimeloyl-ACP methyl ester carboxylesterase
MSEDIRPFTIEVPDAAIDDLRDRLARARWPEAEAVNDWSQGIPLAYTQELCEYWATEYDWRRFESALNGYDNFITEIDGLDIHFIHIRSPHEDATPMVLTHGWPGSVAEFMGVIDPLTNPTEHGGSADDAFHLVIPSLPGYGWSAKPDKAGRGIDWVATAWNTLMVRLGYDSYVAQGGDWGGAVTTYIGMQNLGNVRAIHTNMPVAGPTPESLADPTPQEADALGALGHYDKWDSGYSKQQSTRPQTLGYGLVDSAAGQCAWIAEKMWAWTDNDGNPESALTKDQMLDNISIYWFTASAASSARLYWESFGDFGSANVEIPTGCSIFPKEIIRCSRRWAEQRYTNIQYWNELPKGGHFAAWEQPATFVTEMRAAFQVL